MVWFHIICWGLPILLVGAAAICRALGADSGFDGIGWCWIATSDRIIWPQGEDAQIFWQVLFFWILNCILISLDICWERS